MRPNETFHRVQTIHESRGRIAYRFTRRDAETRGGVPQASGCESESPWPKTWNKEKAENYSAFRFRPLGFRYELERRPRYFSLLRRQFRVGQSLAYDLRAQQTKAVCVIERVVLRSAIVKSGTLVRQRNAQGETVPRQHKSRATHASTNSKSFRFRSCVPALARSLQRG